MYVSSASIAKKISIHSLRMEGDTRISIPYLANGHFNPLPPHGGRHSTVVLPAPRSAISIHSLRMEGDRSPSNCDIAQWIFQSTPSAWRETVHFLTSCAAPRHFNPLPPHGGRLDLSCHPPSFKLFQSTPSAWRETCGRRGRGTGRGYFNPLPPHGGRHDNTNVNWKIVYFNPLPPHGGRRQ